MKDANLLVARQRSAIRSGRTPVTCALGVLLYSVSCAEPPQVAPAPRYPSIERDQPSKRSARITLSEGALPVTLACTSAESTEPNGIDDDCNGQIDRDDNESVFSVAVTHDPRQEIVIELHAADGTTITPARHESLGNCDGARSVAIDSASFASLEPGAYQLILTRGSRCTSEDVKLTHVAIALAGQPPLRFGHALTPSVPTEVATLTTP